MRAGVLLFFPLWATAGRGKRIWQKGGFLFRAWEGGKGGGRVLFISNS